MNAESSSTFTGVAVRGATEADILMVQGPAGMLVRVKHDGRLDFGSTYSPDDAARKFWEAIAQAGLAHRHVAKPEGQEDERRRFETFVKPHDAALRWLGDALGYESHFTHWMWKCWVESGRQPRASLPVPPAAGGPLEVLTYAARDVLAERKRQINVEGWDAAHDDEHADGSMALAAACYAMFASHSDRERCTTDLPAELAALGRTVPGWAAWLEIWPWNREWWKPKTRRQDLIRAGSLILAEIERLDRARDTES